MVAQNTVIGALFEQRLLDPVRRVTIVDLPSCNETALLVEFRILQELKQFQKERDWIAYVAPTGALATRITCKLKTALEPTGVRIEQLTDSIEFCPFEEKFWELEICDSAGSPICEPLATHHVYSGQFHAISNHIYHGWL